MNNLEIFRRTILGKYLDYANTYDDKMIAMLDADCMKLVRSDFFKAKVFQSLKNRSQQLIKLIFEDNRDDLMIYVVKDQLELNAYKYAYKCIVNFDNDDSERKEVLYRKTASAYMYVMNYKSNYKLSDLKSFVYIDREFRVGSMVKMLDK